MIPFTRTFHTVGQGAFYSECLAIDSPPFTMIYDCGSDTLNQALLEKRVNSDLGNTQETEVPCDILFISHFDRDHINGVQFLNPRIVVIPFLSKTQKILLRIYNVIFGEAYDLKLIERPEEVFPNAKIIRVHPPQSTEEGNFRPDPEDYEPQTKIFSDRAGLEINPMSGSTQSLPQVIASSIPIRIRNEQTLIWEYIPFNPNWDKYAAKFKQNVLDEHLDWNKLSIDSNGKYIKKYFSVLKAIYNSMRPKNDHSLVVYSNSLEESRIQYHCMRYVDWRPWHHHYISGGCIYFGDATIEDRWLNEFYHNLEDDRLSRVGIFQVSHHGSYLSNRRTIFPNGFIYDEYLLCIISVGEENKHGHPSAKVIQDLESKGASVVLVTESSSSLIYGRGKIL